MRADSRKSDFDIGRWLRRSIREPLLHFVVIGVALFVTFEWLGGERGATPDRIIVPAAQVEQLARSFSRSQQRAPTDAELKALVDDVVREEIAHREAIVMGLDRDDIIIRRRLRQKFEFLMEDVASAAAPTDAQLQAWLTSHPEAFRVEPETAFRQVFIDDARGDAEVRAKRMLGRLRSVGPRGAIGGMGDPTMLEMDVPLSREVDIARAFGSEFASEVLTVSAGRWHGPIRSSFGLHLIFVQQKVDGRQPTLAEVRTEVEREFLAQRQRDQLSALYEQLLKKYAVTVERSADGAQRWGSGDE